MQKRFSKKREAIYAALCSTDAHPTAEWVYEKVKPQFPDLSLATVYRNIGEFRREGRIHSVGVVEDHERFDADTSPHAHFVCDKCGEVLDVQYEVPVPHLTGCAEGARVDREEITFRGLCKNCI